MGYKIKYRLFLPPDFLKKEVNERVVFEMLKAAKGFRGARRGIPPEPDFVVDGQGIEVTFASGRDHKKDFIRDFCDGLFDPSADQSESIAYINNALERKAGKFYSTPKTSLAILCMLEIFDWVYPESRERDQLFAHIQDEYIRPGIFENVYLLVPSLRQEWFAYDIRRGERTRLLILNYLQAPYYQAENLIPKQEQKN